MLITVIGGGAAGLMAATVAAWNGAKVRIIERKGKLAKKLLASSNGRGNFSNLDMNETHYYSNNLPFVKKVLDIFGVVQTLSVFEELGIMVKEKGSKLFPYTEKSKDIVTNFIYELEKHNVEVVLNFQVDQIIKDNEKFLIKGQHRVLQSDKVIVATGGSSSPQYGSNGSIFPTLQDLGHSIVELRPGLAPLKVRPHIIEDVAGSKLEGDVFLIDQNGEIVSKNYTGEILFKKDDVLSGIPILELSNYVHEYLEQNIPLFLKIIPFPHYSHKSLVDFLTKKIRSKPERPIKLLLVSIIDERFIRYFLSKIGFKDLEAPVSSLNDKDIEMLADNLKEWNFEVVGTTNWKDSQISLGGINTTEIDPYLLESTIIPDLFFAGEVMDVAGESGGYNLQWAWSSGYLAGNSASSE
ncbi:hypothetical protein X925_04285 [Petrotoga sp. 9T1HF07.CasAA.8.2]|uniref:NAD(P)/FAD-dependent oxidoreductase n=1 Tax=Petrotoga sp. 9T1HF07.CasAA.8.2 TaxID=1434329 RepID=UPI000CC57059|nr:aminoacetone oxidase family FAD-binding enzyme [Petrotoga sp. 9T1HF07.CasAA.8.2]PNR89090.1 hypothetical protein X925_04285 [Petrotoga sp. 9T1HF07.CasAA.8.2]